MTSDTVTEDRERSSAILIAALLLSLIAHAALMVSLRQCSFNTFADAARSSRKWTRDLPTMHVVRHTGDPLAAENVRGRPAAAPVVESVQERVALLPDYNLPGSESAGGNILSGLVGTGLVLGLCVVVGALFRRRARQ